MTHRPATSLRPPRALVSATLSNMLAVLPLFLLGAFAVLVRAELDFSEAQLGLAAASFSLTAMLGSVPGGRLGERFGATRMLHAAAALSGLGLAGVAILGRSWGSLCAFLAVCGAGNALAQPSANALVARAIPSRRQGLAFGVKQASVPLAGIASGVALPALGLTLGWRWGFGLAVAVAVGVALAVPRGDAGPARRRPRRGAREGDAATASLVLLAVAVGFGAAAANAMSTFYVESAVAGGIAAGTAGLWLSTGGLSGLVARVLYGWVADRRSGRHLVFVSVLQAVGASGFVLLAAGGGSTALALGTVLAFAAGWGWPGLFAFAVVRHNPNAPAAATGITQVGTFAGIVVGPPAFGYLVQATSYPVAWLSAAAALVIAAGLMLLGRRVMIRDMRARGTLPSR